MRQRLSYEIAGTEDGTTWTPLVSGDELFSRAPRDVARGLLESWILDHPREVTGGERIVVPTERHPDAHERVDAVVRVRVYADPQADDGTDPAGEDAEPLAVGYLGHDRRDFTGQQPAVTDQIGGRLRAAGSRVRKVAHGAVNEHRTKTGIAAATAAATAVAGVFAARRLRRPRRSK